MKLALPDIDIDVLDRAHALAGVAKDTVPASMYVDGELKRHPTGVYFQNMPRDPTSRLAAIPSGKKSDSLDEVFGFMKIDIIPNTALTGVESNAHMTELLNRPLDWGLFKEIEVVSQLHHINGHFEVVEAYEPRDVIELAAIIAMIRPAKRYLVGEPWDVVHQHIWKREPGDGYQFKKSHAVAFAMLIVLQLQVMLEDQWQF